MCVVFSPSLSHSCVTYFVCTVFNVVYFQWRIFVVLYCLGTPQIRSYLFSSPATIRNFYSHKIARNEFRKKNSLQNFWIRSNIFCQIFQQTCQKTTTLPIYFIYYWEQRIKKAIKKFFFSGQAIPPPPPPCLSPSLSVNCFAPRESLAMALFLFSYFIRL